MLNARTLSSLPDTGTMTPLAHPAPLPVGDRPPGALMSLGVEEEYLLVDARSWQLVPAAPEILADVAGSGHAFHAEGTSYQVETATPVHHTLDGLRDSLVGARRVLASAARARGYRLVAAASPTLTPPSPLHLNLDRERRRVRQTLFGPLTDNLVGCGRHVHVGTVGKDAAVRASNRMRPWVPTFIALSAGSPVWNGRDTGHASWRSVAWSSWPSAGLPPHFVSTAAYDAAVRGLLDSGAALDPGMVYWDLRPSVNWPTLELRAPDMSPSLDGALLQAAVARALVARVLGEDPDMFPGPVVSDRTLRLARWRAARDGLEGSGLEPFTGTEVPAATLAWQLVDLLGPELEAAGDYDHVSRTLTDMLRNGSSAARQRAVFSRRQSPTDVLRHLADETEAY
ncbi:YbdK family carboxylate-amine ligase [Streptomyces sp. H27-H1]|uniref:carboxylate-amine ligase n=1 Tax=Streptomyces sp. H27-H1 TaxID=2996461 RepID=UPI00226D4983|nr:YbdK family carboxylate-amine ligase [Streptomyces sp. H27-H1]MCY0931631.1 YbdK family carboxylate-amine ligase [Streptomyces sp. H27-H1]